MSPSSEYVEGGRVERRRRESGKERGEGEIKQRALTPKADQLYCKPQSTPIIIITSLYPYPHKKSSTDSVVLLATHVQCSIHQLHICTVGVCRAEASRKGVHTDDVDGVVDSTT